MEDLEEDGVFSPPQEAPEPLLESLSGAVGEWAVAEEEEEEEEEGGGGAGCMSWG